MTERMKRILVVDDSVDSCELYQVALEAQGHTVEVAHDGPAGLEKLLAGDFDVAIIDIGLPGLDGTEVASRARAKLAGSTPRLVALTGYARASDREATRGAGFDVHLTKPVDLDVLLASVVAAPATGS